jgi:hypothetical protein
MKPLKGLIVVLVALSVNTTFGYIIGRSSGYENKWRPLPNPVSFNMWNGAPDPTNCATSVQLAAAQWQNEPRSTIVFSYTGTTTNNTVANDAQQTVCFHNKGHTGNLATCWTWIYTATGTIVHFDVDVNLDLPVRIPPSTYYTWNWLPYTYPTSTQFDFRSVMTHELGHIFQLKDLYSQNAPNNVGKTMYGWFSNGEVRRYLTQDDMDGVAYLYPNQAWDKVWIKDDPYDYGKEPFTGWCCWQSPDIFHATEPKIGHPCNITVTARNMRPDDQYATVKLEVHNPSVSLVAGHSVLWSQTLTSQQLPPGNRDVNHDGLDNEYANPLKSGGKTFTFTWTPSPSVFSQGHFCFIATVTTTGDPLGTGYPPTDNDVALHNFWLQPQYPWLEAGHLDSLWVDAGNPTGYVVMRYLELSYEAPDTGWSIWTVPPWQNPTVLQPTDTFRPMKIMVSAPASAQRADVAWVELAATLVRISGQDTVGDTLLRGGGAPHPFIGLPGDVGVKGIMVPKGVVAVGESVAPACTLYNYGDYDEHYDVEMKIGNTYDEWAQVGAHPSHTALCVTFPLWTPGSTGNLVVACSTMLESDADLGNDQKTGTVQVSQTATFHWVQKADVPLGPKNKRVKDGGCLTYNEESGNGYVYELKGNGRYEFYKYDILSNTWAAADSIPAIGILGKKKAVKKGASLAAGAGNVYAFKGNNSLEFWGYTPPVTDDYPWWQLPDVPAGAKTLKDGSDRAEAVFTGGNPYVYFLKASGTQEFYRYDITNNVWEAKANAPLGVSNKPWKAGSCIASDGATTIWALKGTYNEFYAYDVGTDVWATKTPLPLVGSSLKKKKVKDGAGIDYLGGYVYALKGGNTREFWIYDPATDAWTQSEDMPVGGGKSVKGGGALEAAPDALYALKGNNTSEFYAYTPSAFYAFPRGNPNEMSSAVRIASRPTLMIAPNPFTQTTQINYSLPKAGNVSLKLYDVTGSVVTILTKGALEAGNYTKQLDAAHLARGIYVLRLETEATTLTRKLIVE